MHMYSFYDVFMHIYLGLKQIKLFENQSKSKSSWNDCSCDLGQWKSPSPQVLDLSILQVELPRSNICIRNAVDGVISRCFKPIGAFWAISSCPFGTAIGRAESILSSLGCGISCSCCWWVGNGTQCLFTGTGSWSKNLAYFKALCSLIHFIYL